MRTLSPSLAFSSRCVSLETATFRHRIRRHFQIFIAREEEREKERERKGYHGLSRAKPRKVSNAGEISRGGERAINYRRVRN